jgi:LmbE family N-acetylglucosaminyl deacetylase
MKYLISPHSDDAVLFASYTIQREKPIVVTVTHSTLQGGNGNERILEDYRAMKILEVPIMFLGIDEDKLNEETLKQKLKPFLDDEYPEFWIPAYEENGNPQHNLVNKVIKKMFIMIKEYKTYTGLEDRTIGKEIIPTDKELETKKKAMKCYVTQILNPMTAHYFNTTSEYL